MKKKSDTFDQIKHTAELNAVYEKLDVENDDGDKGNFLFGWQCINPYAKDLLAATKKRAQNINYVEYVYLDEDSELSKKVIAFHKKFDHIQPQSVFCGLGSTSLLFAFAAYLRKKEVTKVYFIPPLYFTLHKALDMFRIKTIPISALQPFEDGFSIDLPSEKNSILLITDPVWYSGTQISKEIIDKIRVWQKKTQSIVFVDGSFQYMSWNKNVDEATASLDPSLTFRLICPSKQLATHGYRFSYMLLPEALKQDFSWGYTNIYGSANADTVAFAHEAMAAVTKRDITNKLMGLISERYQMFKTKGILESDLNPSCGYFVFGKPNIALPEGYVKVEGKFFDQHHYPDYTKINLLSPSIHLLGI